MRRFKKCIVTGATGSGGSYLIEHILNKKKSIKIFGFYRSKGYFDDLKKYKNCKLIKINLLDYKNTKKQINKIKPDVIFHLASDANVRNSFDDPINNSINNNTITINLLEAVRRLNIDPVILICSSSEVYGNVPNNQMPINEHQPIKPINPYAVTKAYQDLISQVYFKSFKTKVIITRMFSYTNARRKNLFQTHFASQIAEIERGRKSILMHGNLKSKRTFVDIYDAMEAYWLAATKGKIGEIYNIAGNDTISVNNFLKKLIKLSKKKIIAKLDPKLIRPVDINLQIADSRKFKKHTGWKPKVGFDQSVEKLLDECRNLID